MKATTWRLIVIAAVLVWAAWNAWPRPEEGRPFLNMYLGLDLKGGSHLVMQVVTNDAIKAQCDLVATQIGEKLRAEGYPQARAILGEELGQVVVNGIPGDRLSTAQSIIDEEFESWSVAVDGDRIVMSMSEREKTGLRDQAVKQALTTVRNRIDEFGVAEPNIQRIGTGEADRILVELPGVEDPSRVKRIIQAQAKLELRLAYYAPDGSGPFRGSSEEDVIRQLGGSLPPGVEVLPLERKNPETGEKQIAEFWAVEKTAAVTGADLQNAQARKDQQWGRWEVDFQLRVRAADRFAKFTRANIQRYMPVILDRKIATAPVIESEIGSSGRITGDYTFEEAEDLALVLRAGALPARMITIEERTVGPSLGWDSIQAGIRAAGIGFVLVMLFMLLYYKLSGLNAVIALLLNLLLVAAAMASVGAALTLPGIAGFILTVGMAVDANVLIFERVREELRSGKTVKGALDAGFSKALSAIFDANITTLIAALFLFQYGTGPVRGFAVTLSVGIVASLFTAIFVSRTLFMLVIGDRPVQRLSI
ncbi:MAG: protein translocase subunit SecD [Acidobacteriota bacterium]|nr:protein translocase subunit SecD [Acidobacteriota bacterium]